MLDGLAQSTLPAVVHTPVILILLYLGSTPGILVGSFVVLNPLLAICIVGAFVHGAATNVFTGPMRILLLIDLLLS